MATYYAGVGGNDANAGTSYALRKLTIQAAVNIATTAGDRVLVSPGTYREKVTMGSSGSAGNAISLIGDYTGASTSGTKGVVRITGSNDDQTATQTSCIVASGKSYLTISGFHLCGCSSHAVYLTNGVGVTVSTCAMFDVGGGGVESDGASQSAITVSRCYIQPGAALYGVQFEHSSALDALAHVVQNCILVGSHGGAGVRILRIGGITVSNCTILGGQYGVNIAAAMNAGQTLTVNNCIVKYANIALRAVANDGTFVEDYNTLDLTNSSARSNVTAGANSVARMSLFDPRWFFEMVNGGRMVTPFDLASYSSIVEYTSGTGAPSTDIRGSSQVGSYRELGAVEYDSSLNIAGGGGLITHPGMGGGIRG